MAEIKRGLDVLTKEQRTIAIRELSTYCATELDLEIGMIAAEDLLDFFLRTAGGAVYNKGVEDARKLMRDRMADFEVGADLLAQK